MSTPTTAAVPLPIATTHSSPRISSRAGMTIIETMIAMAILGIGLTASFGSMINARKVNEHATNAALAYQEIQAQIETYQYLPFITLQRDFKGTGFAVKGLSPAAGRPCGGTITRVDNIDPYATTPASNAFSSSDTKLPLRFRCEWDEGGSPMSIEIVYVVVYRGI